MVCVTNYKTTSKFVKVMPRILFFPRTGCYLRTLRSNSVAARAGHQTEFKSPRKMTANNKQQRYESTALENLEAMDAEQTKFHNQ